MAPVAVAAVALLTATAASSGVQAYTGVKNLENSRRLRNAQENLERERKQQLAAEAASREAAAARAATAGQRVGRGSLVEGIGGTGFGSGNSQDGLGAGNLFGN